MSIQDDSIIEKAIVDTGEKVLGKDVPDLWFTTMVHRATIGGAGSSKYGTAAALSLNRTTSVGTL